MQRTIVQLRQTGYRVKDLTQKSWVLGKKSCDALSAALVADRIPMGTTVVLDLFGNTSTKFKQEDNTLALAVIQGGGGGRGRHMLGEVVYTPDNFIAEQVATLRPVLDMVKNLDIIFIPPVPRFAFGGCCENTMHAPNTRTSSHSTFALTEHV